MIRLPLMTVPVTTVLAAALVIAVPAATAPAAAAPADPQAGPDKAAAPAKPKRTAITVRRSRGYGFLPGYEPPDRPSPYRSSYDSWVARPYGPGRRYLTPGGWQWVYGWGGARFYQGRWNGGGFGPCWTDTPVGPVWNCGR